MFPNCSQLDPRRVRIGAMGLDYGRREFWHSHLRIPLAVGGTGAAPAQHHSCSAISCLPLGPKGQAQRGTRAPYLRHMSRAKLTACEGHGHNQPSPPIMFQDPHASLLKPPLHAGWLSLGHCTSRLPTVKHVVPC
ncbi:hypothetical protein HaLaN_32444 [Haematococcus lacustris]|uniref:Uncharacterized protein n=1 Tax=Haematococcus lacustris TaxID=44745 RepID=A0A6A0ALL0_HAELA|nr:hypothetical protein HaLaN_32444 [Haematococcus lacustris]